MNKKQKYKIFTLDYLQHEEFTEDDLKWLFDTPSFTLSLIIGEFKLSNTNLEEAEIIDIVTGDADWMYKYFFNEDQRNQFLEILVNCYKNLYSYTDSVAKAYSDFWFIQYGLTDIHMKGKQPQTFYD